MSTHMIIWKGGSENAFILPRGGRPIAVKMRTRGEGGVKKGPKIAFIIKVRSLKAKRAIFEAFFPFSCNRFMSKVTKYDWYD